METPGQGRTVAELAANHAKMAKYLRRVMHVRLGGAWRSWAAFVATWRRRRRISRAATLRLYHRQLGRAWRRWGASLAFARHASSFDEQAEGYREAMARQVLAKCLS
jgi:hypothetical protein